MSAPEKLAIPELCNTTSLALLVLFSELLVVVLLFAGGELSWLRFGLMSLFVQWVALVSAGLLCAQRRWLGETSLGIVVAVMYTTVLLVTLVVGVVAEWLVPRPGDVVARILGQLLVAGIITGLMLRYFYVQQRLRLQEQAELQSRIQALQSRIRPHFLFNSMNIIASLIAVDPDTAETVVEDLSELFRASLNEAGNQVALEEELDLCRRYIRIEALRLGDRLEMDWQIESVGDAQIPLLTLQPLLENAIYHGVQPLPDGGTISVRVGTRDDGVFVKIVNPRAPLASVPAGGGSGTQSSDRPVASKKAGKTPEGELARASAHQGNRMALQNIRSRLQALYGSAATLTTEEVGQHFVTELKFPKSPAVV